MEQNNNNKKLRFVTLDREETQKLSAVLKVVGVGGGGCNAIDSMIHRGLSGVEFIAINTDAQALAKSLAPLKVQIGSNITRGLGTGAIPNIGKKAAEEDRDKLTRILDGSDMVFVTCGMGGGTGTGAAPIVASIAKSLGALVVGIVTKPFTWEGKQRMKNAEEGIKELRQYVDSLIVIPNSRILSIIDNATAAIAAFDKPNEILYEATRGIADIITMTGIINVDFADVRTVMKDSGQALMGCGIASGENRAVEAAQKAISSPLLEGISIKGAKNILLNVSGSSNMTMQEIEAGNNIIFQAAGEEANVIFGAVVKEELNDYISYTVIATGFGSNGQAGNLNNLKQDKDDKSTQRKPSSGLGGFSKDKIDLDNNDDLNIPTILRMRRKDPDLFPDDDLKTGFKAEPDAFDSNDDFNNKKKKDDNDEEDSSSFLRKIMD
ncbi:MAG: cell division protein FtsZ [Melioribacter sp.]|uniref:cell division protein FtsZ n=1 Tax=Rosettibacter primus TaxID=3111523 RepID=UPI00247CD1DB|nr:cell division protein FtsZ [Melioribacter sp.]